MAWRPSPALAGGAVRDPRWCLVRPVAAGVAGNWCGIVFCSTLLLLYLASTLYHASHGIRWRGRG